MDLDEGVRVLFLGLILMWIMLRVRNTKNGNNFSRAHEEHNVIVFATRRLRRFVHWLEENPDPPIRKDPIVERLLKRWKANNTQVRAIPPSVGYAAYTRNKGKEMTLCIPDNKREMQKDTVTFVLTHELAHMASNGSDHDKEFKTTFKRLLELALQAGLYEYQNFSPLNSGTYCGTEIKHTPIRRGFPLLTRGGFLRP
jgi:hypothetical protein